MKSSLKKTYYVPIGATEISFEVFSFPAIQSDSLIVVDATKGTGLSCPCLSHTSLYHGSISLKGQSQVLLFSQVHGMEGSLPCLHYRYDTNTGDITAFSQ